MNSTIKYLTLLIAIVKATMLWGQEYEFERLLSMNNAISDMAIDNNGLVWMTAIGGEGLYHYNGSEFVNVAFKDYGNTDSTSLSTTLLTSLAVDQSNNLWIGTIGYGLEYYDAITNQFTHYRHRSSDDGSIANDTITDVYIDKKNNLWVGTSKGLSVKWNEEETFSTYYSANTISNIHQDKYDRIWVCFGDKFDVGKKGGLAKYDVEDNTFEVIIPLDSTYGSFGQLFTESRNLIRVAVEDQGIAQLEVDSRTLSFPAPLNRLTEDQRTNGNTVLFRDEDENIWVGHFDEGLSLYNTAKDSITHTYGLYEQSKNGFNSLPTSYLYEPEYGIFWIGSFDGIFAITKPDKFRVPFHRMPYFESNSMFLQRDVLLIATSDFGLVQKHLKTGDVRVWSYDLEEADFIIEGLRTIWGLRVDLLTKTIWLASVENGLYRIEYSEISDYPFYSPTNVRNYRHDPDDENSLPSDIINGLIIDRDGLIWAVTNEGLSSFDPLTDRFTNYTLGDPTNQREVDNQFICVDEGFGGSIWVGGGEGISLLDKETGKFTTYPMGGVRDIYVDHFGAVWAGNRSGMYYYDRNSRDFLRLDKEDIGVELRNVIGIVEDWDSKLWISTKNQIVRLDTKRNKALVFGANQGVTFSQMGWQDNHVGHDDKIYIGHHNGYYVLDPKEYQDIGIPEPTLNFSTLKIGNEVITPGDGNVLDNHLSKMESISLQHDQNTFSIEFTSADYYFNQSPDFRFMLDGYNAEWNELGNDNKVFFFQVPPDDYVLRVMAVNEAGFVTNKELQISIGKPWWRKSWAYLLYFLSFVFFILTIHKIQQRRTLNKERERVKDQQLEQAKEIEQAYQQLRNTQTQLIHSEKMASLGELTAGIAHEIQNPLNFVNNFSDLNKELVDELRDEIAKGNLEDVSEIAQNIAENEEKITFHGKRAEEIVKSMLQHSRNNSGEKELTDINVLADEYLRLAYHGLRAKDKSFNAEFNAILDPKLPKISVVPQDIGRVLLNLINNAFQAVSEQSKISKNGYVPTVEVITRKKSGQVEIEIRDNGPGIPEEIKDKIFQPFFTTKQTGQGTGLGLSMSFDIITKGHNGSIEVACDKDEGTIFKVSLNASGG